MDRVPAYLIVGFIRIRPDTLISFGRTFISNVCLHIFSSYTLITIMGRAYVPDLGLQDRNLVTDCLK